jgi:methenyltetrahydromethanopterin cyclohydrolase
MISINERVMEMVRHLIVNDEALGCRNYRLKNGTHVIDMGIDTAGGWEAARLFTEINMAGLGTCSYTDYPLDDDLSVPAVQVFVDNPELACLVSQIAGLKLVDGEYAAIGSGPARALAAAADDHCFELTSYRDVHHRAVLGLQMTHHPDEKLAETAASACGVKTEDLYLLVHASTSIVASVQVSARIVEQTINKMIRKGFDLSGIVMARGLCIVAPPVDDELAAMGRINDCLLYGGKSSFYVRSSDEEIERVLPQLVTESAADYGKLFVDLFEEAGRNFYNMDLDIHSPAQVQVHNMSSGRMFTAGKIRKDIMKKSLFGLE